MELSESDIARFWSKVDKSGDCWEWLAGKTPTGYGQFKAGGVGRGPHRVAFFLANGPIPDGLQVDHRCHNRACVNPEHLRLATRKQNREHMAGAQSNSELGLLGVQRQRDKFRGCVRHWGRQHYTTTFATAQEASEAARLLRNQLFTHNDKDRA